MNRFNLKNNIVKVIVDKDIKIKGNVLLTSVLYLFKNKRTKITDDINELIYDIVALIKVINIENENLFFVSFPRKRPKAIKIKVIL